MLIIFNSTVMQMTHNYSLMFTPAISALLKVSYYQLQLQNCLSDVNNWMSNHFLKLNVDKTEVMEESIYPNLLPKVFHNFSLLFDQNARLNFSTVKHVKNLGFVFDDSLNLTSQINQIVKTCYHRLNNLYRVGSMLSKDRKLQLVTVYVFSCLDNCNILY